MAKAFSVASWNVKHFGATSKNSARPTKPVEPIIQWLADQRADVIAVYEVVGKVVFDHVVSTMPQYQWNITEGPQSQEILIGAKRTLSTFYTQKLEFKSGQEALRPGALLTIIVDEIRYPLLFLHLKSMPSPKGHGLRDDMLQRAINFRKVLNKAQDGPANYIFLGDLNTMGMNLTYSDKDLSGAEEIERLEKRLAAKSVQMRLLDKSHLNTYWPGSTSSLNASPLDHVVAANHLQFKQINSASIDVRGWVNEGSEARQDAWSDVYSDHALLYFEVQKIV